ncbi:uncharacterized protein NPIL_619751, partial [Nephila pilipes]
LNFGDFLKDPTMDGADNPVFSGSILESPKVPYISESDEILDKETATVSNNFGTNSPECNASVTYMSTEKSNCVAALTPESSVPVHGKVSESRENNIGVSKFVKDLNKLKPNMLLVESKSETIQDKVESYENSTRKTECKSQTKKRYFSFRVKEYNIFRISKNEILYKCHICTSKYKQKFSLHRHFLRNHIDPKHISPADLSNCKINVPHSKEISLHIQEESKMPSGRKRYNTDDWEFFESNKDKVLPDLYKCNNCPNIRFDYEEELIDHFDWHFNCGPQSKAINKHKVNRITTAFHCKRCSVSFKVKEDYTQHLDTHPNNKKCKYCLKVYSTSANRKRHEEVHEGGRGFSCKHCKAKFPRSKELENHVKKMHTNLSLTCSLCPEHSTPAIFPSLYLLQMHKREKHKDIAGHTSGVTNNGYKPRGRKPSESVCCFCNKRFPSVKTMVKHKNMVHKKETRLHKPRKPNQQESNAMLGDPDCGNAKILKEKNLDKNIELLDTKRASYSRKVKQASQERPMKGKPKKKESQERIEENRWYAGLPEEIAENLSEHVDGKRGQFKPAITEFIDEPLDCRYYRDKIPWSFYNFPDNFDVNASREEPREGASYTDHPNVFQATGLERNETEDMNLNTVEKDMAESDPLPNTPLQAAGGLKVYLDSESFINTSYICKVCTQAYQRRSDFENHFINNHPNVEISFFEIEGTTTDIPQELCRPFFSGLDGILIRNFASSPLPFEQVKNCSKCRATFKNMEELYLHILQCGNSRDYHPCKKKQSSTKRLKYAMSKKQKSRTNNLFKYGIHRQMDDKPQNSNFGIQRSKRGRRSPSSLGLKPATCSLCQTDFASEVKLHDHAAVCPQRYEKRKPDQKYKKVKMQRGRKSPNLSSSNSSGENGTDNRTVLSSRFSNNSISASSNLSNQMMAANIIVTTAEVHSESLPLNHRNVITALSVDSLQSSPEPSVLNEKQLDKPLIDDLRDLVSETEPCIPNFSFKGKDISHQGSNIPKIKEVVKEMKMKRKTPASSNLKKNSALPFVATGIEEPVIEKSLVTEQSIASKAELPEISRKRKKRTPVKRVLKTPAEAQIDSIENANLTLVDKSVVVDIHTSAEEVPNNEATAADLVMNDACIKQDKFPTTLFLQEEGTRNVSHSEDRDSPTLELLVSSVTQNIENFDKPSLLDDEKFALPPSNMKSTILMRDVSDVMDSPASSLNFKVIIPNNDSTSLTNEEMTVSSLAEAEKETLLHLQTISGNPPQHHDIISDANDKIRFASEDRIDNKESLDKNITCNNLLQISEIPFQVSNIFPVHTQDPEPISSKSYDETNNSSSSTACDISPLVQQNSSKTKDEESQKVLTDDYLADQENKQLPPVAFSTKCTSSTILLNSGETHYEGIDAELPSSKKLKKNTELLYSNGREEEEENRDFHSNNSDMDGALKRGKKKSKLPQSKIIEKVNCSQKKIETDNQVAKSLNYNSNNDIAKPDNDSSVKNLALKRGKRKSTLPQSKMNSEDLVAKSRGYKSNNITKHQNGNFSIKSLSSKRGTRKSKLPLGKTMEGVSYPRKKMKTEDQIAKLHSCKRNNTAKHQNGDASNKNGKLRLFRMKKSEDSESKNRQCPFCYLEFAYLSNFRRHISKCPNKSENVAVENVTVQTAPSSSQLQHLPNKDEVAQSMLCLVRHQHRQSQMISSELNFKRFNCTICHKIFFNLIDYMKHSIKHSVVPGKMTEFKEGSSTKMKESGYSSEMNFTEDFEAVGKDSDTSEKGIAKENASFQNTSFKVRESDHSLEMDFITDFEAKEKDPDKSEMSVAKEDESFQNDTSTKASKNGHSLKLNLIEDSGAAKGDCSTNEKSVAEENKNFHNDTTPRNKFEAVGKKDTKVTGCSSNNGDVPIAASEKDATKNLSSMPISKNVNPNKYKELLDPSILVLPSYGKGRGRKKKSVSNNCEQASTSAGADDESSLKKSDETSSVDNDFKTCAKESFVTKLRKNLSKRIHSGGVSVKASPVKLGNDVLNLKEKVKSDSEQRNETMSVPSVFPFTAEASKNIVESQRNDCDIGVFSKITAQDISLRGSIVSKRGRRRAATVPKQLNIFKKGVRKSASDSQNAMDELTPKIKIEEVDSKVTSFKSPPVQSDCLDIPDGKKIPVSKSFPVSVSTKPSRSMKNSVSLITNESSPKVNLPSNNIKGMRSVKSFPGAVCDGKQSSLNECKADSDLGDLKLRKKKMNRICPICKKKFSSTLHQQRHMLLVHSRKNKRIDVSPMLPKEEGTGESSKPGRPSFQRQCSKPLPPMKRPYKKNINKP